MNEEQCEFGEGRGCVDQIFTLRTINDKYLEKGKKLYVTFTNLAKAHDKSA